MEAGFRPLLELPSEAPSTIANVLSLHPSQHVPQMRDDFVDDDDDYEVPAGAADDAALSDADSDDFRLQADIAKLDADVAAFRESMGGAFDADYDDEEDLIDPALKPATRATNPRKRGGRKDGRRPKRRRVGGGAAGKGNVAEPSPEIKMLLSRASDALLRRDLDRAFEVVEEVIRLNAETYDAWMILSSIHQAQGHTGEAIMAMCFAAHLRPRDFDGWLTTAQFALDDTTPEARERNLEVAQLCYSAAIRANTKSLKARIGKANCALEAGKSSVAAAEYVKVLKKRPYNMAVLRNLAEAAFDTRAARKYVQKALGFYEVTIAHVRTGGQLLRGTFEWSDVIIYAEMCAFLERYSDAALALRSLSRMLIGRQQETFWDTYVDDDREWDADDERKREVPEYIPDKFPFGMYGPALPLDLRAKLAIYRLKLGHEEEATRHLRWLTPTPGFENTAVHDYFQDSPFVIKELANQLFENRNIHTALEFYEFYERLSGEVDSEMLVQKGRCYLQMEDQAKAEDFFLRAIEVDDDNIEARMELAQLYERHQEKEEAFLLVNEAIALEDEQRREDEEYEEESDGGEEEENLLAAAKARRRRRIRDKVIRERRKGQRPKRAQRQHMRRMAGKAKRELYEQNVTEVFRSKYHKVQALRERMANGDIEAEEEWMAAAQDLVDDFRSFKEFYPWDKYLNFLGYGSFFQENRKKAAAQAAEDGSGEQETTRARTAAPMGNSELAAMAERLQQNLAPGEGETASEPVLQRHEHRGIPFESWLDLFLEYAISLARRQQAQEAYTVCQSARDSIVYKSSDNTFLIHVAWAACAVYAADEETCVAVARFFMRFCHASTDSYRVFSALCRLCQCPVSWYSSGPAQKYILRQIKAMDRALLPPELAQKAMGAWDTAVPREDASGLRHEALDVTLLMLYGHILLTSTSYTYALNYFLRAASLDPTNPMVNLSAGIAYVHYAMKRQAENRQFIIAQGMHYMFEYYNSRSRSADVVERLEAHYNVARCYHLLGIYHLAADFYSRVLGEAKAYARKLEENEEKGLSLSEFVYESAVNLRTYALTNGDFDGARALTETWLVL